MRRFVRWLTRRYYPHVHITGKERIPATGPVLLCANHPNSLLDPPVVGLTAGRPVKFFAKAPLFEKPVLGSVMKALGMIPAYRGSDDRKQVRRNLESLDRGIEQLVQGNVVGIFPEGKSHDRQGVEMVRGGAARMALEAVRRGAKGLQVVPLGLNYERKEQFRSGVWVRIAEPISMDAWLAENESQAETDRQLSRRFTGDLQKRLQQVTIHLQEDAWQPWLNRLEYLGPDLDYPRGSPVPRLHIRKQIADAMNHFMEHDHEATVSLGKNISDYVTDVQRAGLDPAAPVLNTTRGAALRDVALQFFVLLLLLIPAVAGTLFHLVPFWIVRLVAGRMTPPGRTAVSFYRLLIGLPVYVAWYGLVFFVALGRLPVWQIAVSLSLMPLFGVIALQYWTRLRSTARDAWCQFLAILNPGRIRALMETRGELTAQIQQLAERAPTLQCGEAQREGE
jgi:1-acyl-sn-glycerol-3-phosphate acyltransferase